MEITLDKPKTKSSSNGKAEHPEPFYVDRQKLETELRNQSRVTSKIQNARATYESITADVIQTIEQLRAMVTDPIAYFVRIKEQHAEKQKEKLAEVFGGGLDVKSFIKNSLPERFQEVVNACRLCESVEWTLYTIAENGKLELTQAFHDRLKDRCYYFAETENQRKRLAFARKMVRMLDFEMRQLLQDQAAENGTEHAIADDLKVSRFVAGLPACCRIIYDPSTDSKRIAINEGFVVDGFGRWTPNVIKPVDRTPRPRRVRLCMWPGGSGVRYTHFEHPKWPVDPTRMQKTVVLPNWFEIRDGKCYDTGKRAPRLPDAPLLTQLSEMPNDITGKPYLNVV